VLPPVREVRLEDVQGLPPPIGQQAAPLPPYDPNVPTVPAGSAPAFGAAPVAPPASVPPFAATPADAGTLPPPPISPNEFGGEYGTPVPAPAPPSPDAAAALGATEPASLDRDDDVVDDIDRIFGAPPVADAAAGAFPSQPVPTQRVADNQPGLIDQRPENHPVFVIEDAGAEPTALDLRAGRAARLFWLWFATNSSVLSVAIGAVLLALGMSLRQAIVATLAGVALSFLPLGLGTLAGKWSGQPTMVVSRATFGHIGNILPAILAVLTRVFWGAVLLWLLAVSAARLLVFAGLDAGLGETVWTFVVLGLGFIIAGVIALFGYGFVARLQLILSILSGLLVAGLIYLTLPRLDLGAALGVADGPWTLVLGGAVVVFSFVGLAWVQSSSDVARYQRTASSGAQTMLWATVGATLPPFALIVWGAMLAASDPVLATGLSTSPLPTLARLLPLWYPAPLLAAAGLGLLSSIVLAIYSGGFALQAVGLRARRHVTTILSSVLVAVLAAALVVLAADAFTIARDLATTLAVPVAAWAGIFSAEMMIRTRRFDSPSLLSPGGVYPQVRVANLIGFIVITVIGFGLSSATFPGLTWQGYLFPLLGVASEDPIATSDAGVLVALVLGIIVPLATAIPAIRKQERDSLYLEHTGPIPRQTGSIPRQTGSVPRQTGSVPRPTGSVPMPPPSGGAPS
jgi:purine-cytosine permease-like protein